MTNQTIPPCPKCGKVPTLIMYGSKFPFVSGVCQCLSDANLIGNSDRTYPVCWENGVDILLGRACRELGIETVEQLKALAKGAHCIVCGNDSGSYGEQYWTGEEMDVTEVQCEWCWTEPNSIFNRRRIAAQRGEG